MDVLVDIDTVVSVATPSSVLVIIIIVTIISIIVHHTDIIMY